MTPKRATLAQDAIYYFFKGLDSYVGKQNFGFEEIRKLKDKDNFARVQVVVSPKAKRMFGLDPNAKPSRNNDPDLMLDISAMATDDTFEVSVETPNETVKGVSKDGKIKVTQTGTSGLEGLVTNLLAEMNTARKDAMDSKTARILKARLFKVASVLRNLRIAGDSAVVLKGDVSVDDKSGSEVKFPYEITVPTNVPYTEYLGRINSELEAEAKKQGFDVDAIDAAYDIIDENDPLEEYLKARLSDYIKHDEFIGNKMMDLVIQRIKPDKWYDLTSKDLEGEGTGGLPYHFDYYPSISAFLEAYYSFTESMDPGMSDEEQADDIVAQLENAPEVMEILRDQSETGDVLVMLQP